jgi:hypothetical protein
MSNLIEQFITKSKGKQLFLERYQYLLSIVATFIFFSDLPDYLLNAPILPVIPLVWIGVLAVLSLPFLKNIRNAPKHLLMWMGIYLGVSVLSLLTVSSDEISFTDFRAKVLSVLFILVMYALYQQKSVNHIKYTIIVVLLISVGNNLLELFNPRMFAAMNVGRPAGFYIDPNKSGCALVLGMLMGIGVIDKAYRWIYVAIAGVGIMASFSRGAIIGWAICVALLTAGKVISDNRRKIAVPAIALLLTLIFLNPLDLMVDYFKSTNDAGSNWDIINRLEEFQNPSLKEDSASDRQAVAVGGWMMFSNHPFWGNGLASTRKWNISEVSTHNMYLYFMADHGIIGLIFLPGAVFAVVYDNKGEKQIILLSFAIFISIWGFFSHEVLAERYTLSVIALLAAMNTNQKWYLKFANRNFQMAPPLEPMQLKLPKPHSKKVVFIDRRRD